MTPNTKSVPQPAAAASVAPARRLPRPEAADRLSRLIGVAVAPKTLSRMPVPYLKIGRATSYTEADIDAHAEKILRNALRVGWREQPRSRLPR